MKPDYKLVAKAKYIHNTADLASELWHEVYKRYYPAKQLDTLVEELQSADAIEEDIDNDVNYFLVFLGGKLIGYFAWKMENTALHLMHLYLKPEYRGKAIGRDIVQTCERLAKGEGKGRVWCTIHAKALPVQQFFKALRYRELRPAEQEKQRHGQHLDDIHDRVNYAVEKSELYFNDDKSTLTLELTIDLSISSVMEYFEIFLTRMTLCRRAAETLGINFSIVINGNKIM